MFLCQRLSHYININIFAYVGVSPLGFVFFLLPPCLCQWLGNWIMLALLVSHGVSLADLCSTFNQTLTFICVCLLKFFFFLFLESLEMYYAVLGFLVQFSSLSQKLFICRYPCFLYSFCRLVSHHQLGYQTPNHLDGIAVLKLYR